MSEMWLPHSIKGEQLYRKENLGPCKATVTLEKRRWRAGSWKFVLTEEFTPPQGVARIQVTDTFENGDGAMVMARRFTAQWLASSDRSHRLAPGGQLAAMRPAG